MNGNASEEESECSQYTGTQVAPVSIDEVIAVVKHVPSTKDEFETTAQFEARQATKRGALAPVYIVSKSPDRDYIRYDADAETLLVGEYAFDNLNVGYRAVFGYGTPLFNMISYSEMDNVDVVMSEEETSAGEYVGSNAFGATVRVTKVVRHTKAVFERAGTLGQGLFPAGARGGHELGKLRATPAQARALKANIRVAMVIAPKAPFLASGVKSWGAPTIDDPREVQQPIEVVIADIRCALVLNGKDLVLGAYPTL